MRQRRFESGQGLQISTTYLLHAKPRKLQLAQGSRTYSIITVPLPPSVADPVPPAIVIVAAAKALPAMSRIRTAMNTSRRISFTEGYGSTCARVMPLVSHCTLFCHTERPESFIN